MLALQERWHRCSDPQRHQVTERSEVVLFELAHVILKLYLHLWFLRPDLTLFSAVFSFFKNNDNSTWLKSKVLHQLPGSTVQLEHLQTWKKTRNTKGRFNRLIIHTSSSPRQLPGKPGIFSPMLGEKLSDKLHSVFWLTHRMSRHDCPPMNTEVLRLLLKKNPITVEEYRGF